MSHSAREFGHPPALRRLLCAPAVSRLVGFIALQPLIGSLGPNFSSEWGGDTDLERPEITKGSGFGVIAQAFANKSAECVANGDWANPTIFFLQSD